MPLLFDIYLQGTVQCYWIMEGVVERIWVSFFSLRINVQKIATCGTLLTDPVNFEWLHGVHKSKLFSALEKISRWNNCPSFSFNVCELHSQEFYREKIRNGEHMLENIVSPCVQVMIMFAITNITSPTKSACLVDIRGCLVQGLKGADNSVHYNQIGGILFCMHYNMFIHCCHFVIKRCKDPCGPCAKIIDTTNN